MKMSLTFSEISPYVRWVRVCNEPYFSTHAFPYDNRLFYCTEGCGEIVIEKKAYKIEKDTMILWRGGQEYLYIPDEKSPFHFIGINFDFTSNYSNITAPLFPQLGESFDKEIQLEQVVFEDTPVLNDVIVIPNANTFRRRVDFIYQEFNNRKVFHTKICSGYMIELLTGVVRYCMTGHVGYKQGIVDEILQYVRDNMALSIDNSAIGKVFGYHPNYINALVVKQTGLSLHQYLLQYRMQRAAQYLQESDMPISEVAEACGFTRMSYFSRKFRQYFGCVPSEYRCSFNEKK